MMDIHVMRIKKQPHGQYKAPRVVYRCNYPVAHRERCQFQSPDFVNSWVHSHYVHGPWPIEGSEASAHVGQLTRLAGRNGVSHPRNTREVLARTG
jgi:hypothetical protein